MEKNEIKAPQIGNTTRLVVIFTALFILLSVGFGASIGIISSIDDASALVHLEGVKLREGEVRYLASVYKATYMAALRAAGVSGVNDTDSFWSRTADDGKTYAQKLEDGFAEYLRGMLAASKIFYRYSSYTSEHRAAVDKAVKDKLTYAADGSVEKFNELSEKYGFTYDDFVSATAFIYRAKMAKLTVYGEGGESLSAMSEECSEYLSEYVRVKIMFVREYDRLTESGDKVSLSQAEIAAKAEKIAAIREYIANAKAGQNNAMSPDSFDLFLRNTEFSDSDPTYYSTGYYFHFAAEQTALFAEEFPEVYEAAMELDIGEFGEAEWESGVAFLYRLDVEENAYKLSQNLMFSDFYSDLSDMLYPEMLSTVGEAAKFTELFDEVSVLDVPANTNLVAVLGEN